MTRRDVLAGLVGAVIGMGLGAGVMGARGMRPPRPEALPESELRLLVAPGSSPGGAMGRDEDGVWRGTFAFPTIEDAREGRILAVMAITGHLRTVRDRK